ncbi:MAG: carboxyl transferase domain-containing protein, partial [Bacteroidota bacterium]
MSNTKPKTATNIPTTAQKIERLDALNQEALQGGGEKRIAAQHEKGKLTARKRIEILLDSGSFQEIGKFVTHRATDF